MLQALRQSSKKSSCLALLRLGMYHFSPKIKEVADKAVEILKKQTEGEMRKDLLCAQLASEFGRENSREMLANAGVFGIVVQRHHILLAEKLMGASNMGSDNNSSSSNSSSNTTSNMTGDNNNNNNGFKFEETPRPNVFVPPPSSSYSFASDASSGLTTSQAERDEAAKIALSLLHEHGGQMRKDLFCNKLIPRMSRAVMRDVLACAPSYGFIVERHQVLLKELLATMNAGAFAGGGGGGGEGGGGVGAAPASAPPAAAAGGERAFAGVDSSASAAAGGAPFSTPSSAASSLNGTVLLAPSDFSQDMSVNGAAKWSHHYLQESNGIMRKDALCNKLALLDFEREVIRELLGNPTTFGLVVDRHSVSLLAPPPAAAGATTGSAAAAASSSTTTFSSSSSFGPSAMQDDRGSNDTTAGAAAGAGPNPNLFSPLPPMSSSSSTLSEEAIVEAQKLLAENGGEMRKDLFCNKIAPRFGREVLRQILAFGLEHGITNDRFMVRLVTHATVTTAERAEFLLPQNEALMIEMIQRWRLEQLPEIKKRLKLPIPHSRQMLDEYLTMAFIRSGITENVLQELFPKTKRDLKTSSAQSLEFVGDAALQLAATQRVYSRVGGDEGSMTSLRIHLVSGGACAAYARALDLPRLQMSPSTLLLTDKVANDLAEAIMGAVFLSFGDGAVETVSSLLFDVYIPTAREQNLLKDHEHLPKLLD